MEGFGAATARWFGGAFEAATEVQRRGWESIRRGDHTLLIAPTGSGKTLAAFLWAIDRLMLREESAEAGVRVVYVSPLKALVYDIERNLRVPLRGIERTASGLGSAVRMPGVDVRTGDTPQQERRRQLRSPAEILVTTPESLFLLLGSQARETLRTVEWLIVDEIHAMAGTKRGAHLALSLERLSRLARVDPQRIGLSATARPATEVARFLGGDRRVEVVDAHVAPRLDLSVVVPVEDMTRPAIHSAGGVDRRLDDGARESGAKLAVEGDRARRQFGIWPAVYPELLSLIRAHRTTIIFVNSRGLCERLAQRLNEAAGEELVRAHHGSLAHHQRREIEEALKLGSLRAIIATSSLELGIDMGSVDLVILVESPGSVSRGLQRVGRAGHAVGETSIGRIFPKHRGDLLEAAVVARCMRDGAIEELRIPRNPLDVLAQHIVAMASVRSWPVEELGRVVRRAANFADLPQSALVSVLDMLSGLYPSRDFADLRPRIHWDRERDAIEGRRGTRMLVAVNAGTIPDRGLFGVHMGPDGPRVGELDEEMVHESQPGQTFMLGATTWRILEITRDRVIVEPAPGLPGRLPFWKGEGPGRPLELGQAVGAFVREFSGLDQRVAANRLEREYGLDEFAARNLIRYLDDQRQATGTLPTDRDITVERFVDELGDWRICILSPFGARVHAPWALALRAAVSARVRYAVQTVWSDDGIVLTLAEGDEPPDASLLIPAADEVEERIVEELSRSPLFASQFRENAARALLLPRRRPGSRTPLFAQRLRAQKLLGIAMQYPAFPIVIETFRACLQDIFDVPALKKVLDGIERREIAVHEVETGSASPFARSLVFAYVAAYLYEGDSPSAERRAQALSLDLHLLRELLGEADLRQLLDTSVIAEYEAQVQHRVEARRARDADGLQDTLRQLGHLWLDEAAERCRVDPVPLLEQLERSRRALRIRLTGVAAWIAVEDAGLYRDALGVALPAGVPAVFLESVESAVEILLLRHARTHGPFTTAEVAAHFGLVEAQAEILLRTFLADGRLRLGEFRPDGAGPEWCDAEVLRQLKQRTIARLRGQVAPVRPVVLARFLPSWHGIDGSRPNQTLEEAISKLEGLPLSYRVLERSLLPARVAGFRPQHLDDLGAGGWLVWVGHSPLGADDGRIVLYRRDRAARLLIPATVDEGKLRFDDRHHAILQHLESRGASFLTEFLGLLRPLPERAVSDAVWDLVWAGLVTNDTFASLRTMAGRARAARSPSRQSGRGRRHAVAGGRWSLVRHLAGEGAPDTVRAHALAATLLERHGIVARESTTIESARTGFSAIYRVLRTMEEAGKVRRGYFIESLGGAQFAYPGVIERLRQLRDDDTGARVVLVAATDPANPFGWLLPWPAYVDPVARPPRRAAGATVVLVDGSPVLYLDRGGRRLRTRLGAPPEDLQRGFAVLPLLARRRPRNTLILERVDGHAAAQSAHARALMDVGFIRDYLALRLYSP